MPSNITGEFEIPPGFFLRANLIKPKGEEKTDVTVGCDQRDKDKKESIQYPRLIVEVLSPGTETIDKGEKLDLYLEYPSIEEYILVGSQKKMVEVYHRDEETWVSRRYTQERPIQLSSINVSISFEDIYEKTSLI